MPARWTRAGAIGAVIGIGFATLLVYALKGASRSRFRLCERLRRSPAKKPGFFVCSKASVRTAPVRSATACLRLLQ